MQCACIQCACVQCAMYNVTKNGPNGQQHCAMNYLHPIQPGIIGAMNFKI